MNSRGRTRPPGALRLVVLSDSVEGGLGAVAVQHAEACAAWAEVTLVAPGTAQLAAPPGVRVVDVPLPGSFLGEGRSAAVRALRAVLKEARPDVVHAHGNRSFVLAALAGTRACVTLHGLVRVEGGNRLVQAARDVVARLVPLVARRAWSVSPDAPRGWEFLPHASPRLGEITQHGPSPEPVFVWVGRLSPQKQPEVFLAGLRELGPAVQAVLYGDGERCAEIAALAGAMPGRVHLAGHVTDVPGALRGARALVLLSHYEGVPLVVQEAMWAGLPVVLSPLSGNRWLAGETGLYAREAVEVADALRRLLDLTEARRLGTACADRVRTLLEPGDPWDALRVNYEQMARR